MWVPMNCFMFPPSKQYLPFSDIIRSPYPASFLTSWLYKNITMPTGAKTTPPSPAHMSLHWSHTPLLPHLPSPNTKIIPLPISHVFLMLVGLYQWNVNSIHRICLSLRSSPSHLVCTHSSASWLQFIWLRSEHLSQAGPKWRNWA